MTPVRTAVVQLRSTPDVAANQATADRLVREAASAGARVVLLPEKWSVLGTLEDHRRNPVHHLANLALAGYDVRLADSGRLSRERPLPRSMDVTELRFSFRRH